jgi:hypothetical protein
VFCKRGKVILRPSMISQACSKQTQGKRASSLGETAVGEVTALLPFVSQSIVINVSMSPNQACMHEFFNV